VGGGWPPAGTLGPAGAPAPPTASPAPAPRARRDVLLWRIYGEECDNYMMLQGHKNAVTELRWTGDGETIVTASSDKTARAWDAQTGAQKKKMGEHEGYVNSCDVARRGNDLVVTGADDGAAKVWDLRQRRSVATFAGPYPVLSAAFSADSDMVCAAGLDGAVRVFDLRRQELWMELLGHHEPVTGLAVSPDGNFLLSNAMDNSLRVWDLRPYAPANRCVKVFAGHVHSFEQNLLRCAWSPDGAQVSCGSADGMVNVWDAASRRLLYKLPGHKGSVNDVVFHPKEPLCASASSDKTVYLGELSL